MADTLKLEIVTPAAIVYAEQVAMVTLPAVGNVNAPALAIKSDVPGAPNS